MSAHDYQLLDFGDGRKLERFGRYVLDRPSPAAERITPHDPPQWSQAAARYESPGDQKGEWSRRYAIDEPWSVRFGDWTLELKLTEAGHLGAFPEHEANWRWIAQRVRRAGRIKVLNLFAYTGGATLAAASAGAEVVHVDAAAGVVAWARRNAQASDLADAPIRWIVEDALKFTRRELKRGNTYDAVILDPPAYGHGPQGEPWKLEENLAELLELCIGLCRGREQFLLLSCHTGRLGQPEALLDYMLARCPRLRGQGKLDAVALELASTSGARLDCGAAARFCRE